MKTLLIIFTLFMHLFAVPCVAQTSVPARAAILVNLNNGKILYEKNADLPIPPASLAKIMTMFLAFDAVRAKKASLNQKFTVRETAASVGGSSMRLIKGEQVPLVRLLSGMAVMSGNDAATAVAESIGGNIRNFVASMNVKAGKLGLKHTRFKNPTGLPAPGQKTTARDMMNLCRAYLSTHPEAARFHKMSHLMHKGAVMRNTNGLLDNVPGVNGLKTGWTIASGYNVAITAKRGKTSLLAIVLGANTKGARSIAARTLIETGFRFPAKPSAVKLALAK